MSESKWKEMAERTTILRCLVGSEAYGLSLNSSDRDEKGVCIEDFEDAMPLHGAFEQYEFRTAAARTGKKDAPSEAGDLDLTIYSLRKFLRLACDGNPNIVELLFLKGSSIIKSDARGIQLQELAPAIVSRDCGRKYLGYMTAQRQKMLGEIGQMRVTRTDLIETFGYDTKYAMHLIRLGYQGVELLETGKITLPFVEPFRTKLLDLKQGKWSFDEVLQAAGDLELKVKDLISDGPLQTQANLPVVEEFMQSMYWETWKARKWRHEVNSTVVH